MTAGDTCVGRVHSCSSLVPKPPGHRPPPLSPTLHTPSRGLYYKSHGLSLVDEAAWCELASKVIQFKVWHHARFATTHFDLSLSQTRHVMVDNSTHAHAHDVLAGFPQDESIYGKIFPGTSLYPYSLHPDIYFTNTSIALRCCFLISEVKELIRKL